MSAPALPTSDPPVAFLEDPGGRLAYVDEGPRGAPALLLVHGIPGSVRDFRYLVPPLGPRVRTVRVELPGFGASAPRDEALDGFSGRARALLAVADHLHLPRFAVLGHSMGGGAALALAHEAPTRVSHIVLVASVGLSLHRGLGHPPWVFRLLALGLPLPLVGAAILRASREQYRARGFPGAETLDAAALGLQLRAIAATDFRLLRRLAKRPLPPALVAYARDDRLIEEHIALELAAALPASRTLAFDEGGHNIQKTRAPELAAAVAEHLGA